MKLIAAFVLASAAPAPAPLVDNNPSCAGWAAKGECTTNPPYMLATCAKSCNQSSSQSSPVIPAPESDSTDPKCVDDEGGELDHIGMECMTNAYWHCDSQIVALIDQGFSQMPFPAQMSLSLKIESVKQHYGEATIADVCKKTCKSCSSKVEASAQEVKVSNNIDISEANHQWYLKHQAGMEATNTTKPAETETTPTTNVDISEADHQWFLGSARHKIYLKHQAEMKAKKTEPKTPAVEQPAVQPAVEQPAVEQPAVEQPAVEQPAVEQPAVEKPAEEKPAVEQPAVEQPAVEQPAVEQPTVEQPAVEQPAVEQPAVEQPAVEQLAVEQPAVEQLDTAKSAITLKVMLRRRLSHLHDNHDEVATETTEVKQSHGEKLSWHEEYLLKQHEHAEITAVVGPAEADDDTPYEPVIVDNSATVIAPAQGSIGNIVFSGVVFIFMIWVAGLVLAQTDMGSQVTKAAVSFTASTRAGMKKTGLMRKLSSCEMCNFA